jgi:16S rRNA processing protein RimM
MSNQKNSSKPEKATSQAGSSRFQVAKLGKAVGLGGEMKLHLKTDFPEQFRAGVSFDTKRGELEIESYNLERDLVKFKGYNSAEEAKKLTNLDLFTTEEKTRREIKLEKGQHFWFDIVGSSVYEGELLLGRVIEIERLGITDYLKLETDEDLVSKKMPNSFLIPYHDKFVIEVDTKAKTIKVQGGFDILQAS